MSKKRESAESTKPSKLEARIAHWNKLMKTSKQSNFEAANKKPGTSDCKRT